MHAPLIAALRRVANHVLHGDDALGIELVYEGRGFISIKNFAAPANAKDQYIWPSKQHLISAGDWASRGTEMGKVQAPL